MCSIPVITRGRVRRECAAAVVEIRFSLKAPFVGTRHELARILAADPDSKLTGVKIGQIPKSPRVGNPGALSGVDRHLYPQGGGKRRDKAGSGGKAQKIGRFACMPIRGLPIGAVYAVTTRPAVFDTRYCRNADLVISLPKPSQEPSTRPLANHRESRSTTQRYCR